MHDDQAAIRERTLRWLDGAVIGLRLCPFAAPVRDALVVEVAPDESPAAIFRAVLEVADRMVEASPAAMPTALVVAPGEQLADFEDFLDLAAAVEDTLEASGAAELLQLATFHPRYRFAETDDGNLGNFTNRSPHPTFHLLRVADVAEAIARHPDTQAIPDENIARLEGLGADGIAALWTAWTD